MNHPHLACSRHFVLRLALAIGVLPLCLRSFAADYYVDSAAGDDAANGTSSTAPWKTLAKVNSQIFQPGDRMLFKRGGVWKGVLQPQGSGTEKAHLFLDAYGGGAKPLIAGGGVAATVFLLNQSYWEIHHLEVTNTGATRGEYAGIRVQNNSGHATNFIRIESCNVHDVNGISAAYYGTNVGIAVVADMNGSFWNDVTIENNTVTTVDRMGIFVGPSLQLNSPNEWILLPKSNNVTIQNNVITDSGGDGILNFVTHNTLIQHNVVANGGARASDGSPNKTGYANKYSAGIWSAIATKTVIQYNEVYGERTTFDGEGYDIDLGSDDIAVQYNYSHHNRGGFMLFCESGSRADINNAKIRFNISHDDSRGIFVICGKGLSPAPIVPEINNNTFSIPAHANTPVFIYSGGTLTGGLKVYNNVFYVLGHTDYCPFDGAIFDHNLFYGDHPDTEPADAHKLTADPQLLNAGAATIGRTSTDGYKLKAGSPAIGSGIYSQPEAMGMQDYWGNPLPPNIAPNLGAYNGPGITDSLPNYALNASVVASSSSEQGTWSKSRVVDGQTLSVLGTSGYSSETGVTMDHAEWLVLELGARRKISRVVLFPRTTPGYVGVGFPRSFLIQTWDGSKWVTRMTKEKYPKPDGGAQTFSLGSEVLTERVRLSCSKLDQLGKEFVLQLAEIRVEP